VSITFLHARPAEEDESMRVELVMEGKPEGKARPRLGRGGHVYTPKPTKLAEGRIIDAWTDAGSRGWRARSISASPWSSPVLRITTSATAR
jgi:hypothetical protein